MTPKRKSVVVVVDGSNLATEGRSAPSLTQLDECVRALHAEMPSAQIIVVVDATFEHRIDKDERKRFREAADADEVVMPPAGTIGRGDAFILKIAERANAVVLSNDSFQEFHAEHPWLFEEGRLLGGKPVTGVGWIFAARNPVKGPTSRAVRSRAAAMAVDPAPASPLAPAKRPAGRARSGAGADAHAEPARSRAKQPAKSAKQPTEAPATKRGATVQPRTKTPAKASAPSSGSRARAESAKAAPSVAKKPAAAKVQAAPKRRASRVPAQARVAAPPAKAGAAGKRAAPPVAKSKTTEPANTSRAFEALVANHPLRSTVEGEVASFTSHGAMVTVAVGRGMRVVCYAPLAGLGRPKPLRARDVLKKGEQRTFRVVAFDASRRIAELSLVRP